MTTKLLVLFYASAMAVAIAGEAPSVSGSVKDPQGRPVASANVGLYSRASSASLSTTTDRQGAFRIEGVAPAEGGDDQAHIVINAHCQAPMIRRICDGNAICG
jgi:protocatechuate 3,4-dioxygenase beta subunit